MCESLWDKDLGACCHHIVFIVTVQSLAGLKQANILSKDYNFCQIYKLFRCVLEMSIL